MCAARRSGEPPTKDLDDGDSFEDEVFDGLDLERRDLGGREFYRCVFRNAKLSETTWQRSRMEACRFEACDLTRADVKMLALRGVELDGCKLMGIDWTGVSKNPEVSFARCNLRYCTVVGLSLRKTRFTDCAIVEATFLDTDLAGAELVRCQLGGTRFEGCDLRDARFPESQDLFVDPAKNRVRGMAVPLDAAILLAASFGIRVLGFDDAPADDPA